MTPHFPDPHGSGGAVHQFELLRWAAARHEITLLTTDWNVPRGKTRVIEDLGVRVQTVAWPSHLRPRNKALRFGALLLGAAPTLIVWTGRDRVKPLARAIVREERERRFDLVCVIMGEVAPVLVAAHAPTALLLFDVYSRLSEQIHRDRWVRRVRRRLEKRNARRWEAKFYSADGIACVSSVDAAAASAMLNKQVSIIPNPVPDEFFSPPTVRRSSTAVTFVGSFVWEPNIDSVRWICAEIWPKVLARRPDATLNVVGSAAFPDLIRDVEAVGGHVHSNVVDVRPYYWEAAVSIAPIRMGSGTRNKILHAMACGAPVVTTARALEGIPVVPGEHLLVADDADAFVDAIVAVLNDPVGAAKRAAAARAIPSKYTVAAAGSALDAWWQSLVEPEREVPAVDSRSERSLSATILVCTKERPTHLRRCLTTIKDAAAHSGAEVIIVEQGEPLAEKICGELGLAATIVRDNGFGVSHARNIGLVRAHGDVVLFTDDDCEVPVDWVRPHLDALSDPEVVASFGEVTGLTRWGDERYDPAALPARHGRDSAPWLIGHSSNMAVLRSTLSSVGGFDERLGPGSVTCDGGDDGDLIYRLLRTGSLLVSGTGDAVRHSDWRSQDEHRATLIAYEKGSGAWIGKALRERPRNAARYLRWHIWNLTDYATYRKDHPTESASVRMLAGAFARGLLLGLRMGPWRNLPSSRDASLRRTTEAEL